jgi:hypothetical protein
MPLTPFEIAMSKVWANGLVITVAVGLSLYIAIRGMLAVPIAGSIPLFMVGVVIHLFFATAIGIFSGTVARSIAAARIAVHVGLPADEHALRKQYAAREHALMACDRDASVAFDPFRAVRAVDPLPRCRPRRRLAAIPRGRRGRWFVFWLRNLALPLGRSAIELISLSGMERNQFE